MGGYRDHEKFFLAKTESILLNSYNYGERSYGFNKERRRRLNLGQMLGKVIVYTQNLIAGKIGKHLPLSFQSHVAF